MLGKRGELRQTSRCHLSHKASPSSSSPRHSQIPLRTDYQGIKVQSLSLRRESNARADYSGFDPNLQRPTAVSIRGNGEGGPCSFFQTVRLAAQVVYNKARLRAAITKDCNYGVSAVSVFSSRELRRQVSGDGETKRNYSRRKVASPPSSWDATASPPFSLSLWTERR